MPLLARFASALVLLLTLSSAPVLAQNASDASLPSLTSLDDGWSTLYPKGATTCINDDEYRFYVRPGDGDRLLVYFEGGGACWNTALCQLDGGAYDPGIDVDPARVGFYGIFEVNRPQNPVADYTMVYVPYCTGDTHIGDAEVTYPATDDLPAVTVPHRGLVNAGAVLDWTYANVASPSQILVTGSSAGGVAAPFFADLIARQYPEARVIGLGDAAGGYRSSAVQGVDSGQWGVPGVLQQYPGWDAFEASSFGIETLYLTAAADAPSNLELYQVDQAYDEAQRWYVEQGGSPDADLLALIRENRAEIRAAHPSFRAFTVGGYEHMVLVRPHFYFYKAEGTFFRDWFAAVLDGDAVESVECTSCERPDVRYTEKDLAGINRTIELLATEDAWDSNHEGECPQGEVSKRSLRCAMFHGFAEAAGSPLAVPGGWDVAYEAAERLGQNGLQNALNGFNNREETSFEDVRALLLTVRARIETALTAQPEPAR